MSKRKELVQEISIILEQLGEAVDELGEHYGFDQRPVKTGIELATPVGYMLGIEFPHKGEGKHKAMQKALEDAVKMGFDSPKSFNVEGG